MKRSAALNITTIMGGISMGTQVKLVDIIIDDKIHPRDSIDQDVVGDYADRMREGAVFPEILVFQDDKKYHLADGRHRFEAARKRGLKSINAEVRKGDKRAAILASVAANNKHGLQRSNADKRKSVKILLQDKEWRKWAHNKLGDMCNVSDGLVKAVYLDVQDELHLPKLEDATERIYEKDGKIGTVNTAKIGKRKPKAAPKPPDESSGRTLYAILETVAEARDKLTAEHKPQLIKRIDAITDELQDILGKATEAKYRLTKDLNQPLNVYERARVAGIKRSLAFEKKKLATHYICVGLACGHQCTYCSVSSNFYANPVFTDIHQTSFQKGFAIIDPDTPKRALKSIPKLTASDVIQFSTLDDGWSPEAREYDIGRKTMKVLLENTDAKIRVLTKSAAVANDFDLFAKYKNRIMLGLSTGIPKSRGKVASVLEPNASPIKDRLDALKKAHKMGIPTFGMLCPCLPHIASSKECLEEMFDAVIECGVEAIWLEPVNGRSTLPYTEQQLRRAGFTEEAVAVGDIRADADWSKYAVGLIQNAISVSEQKGVLDKLNVLLYSSGLSTEHIATLKKFKQGIVWLDDEDTAIEEEKSELEAAPLSN